jgi:hypothetical protein
MVSALFKFGMAVVVLCVLVDATVAAPQRLKWRKSTIEVGVSTSLLDNNTNLPSREETLTAIKLAFETWEAVTNVTFRSTTTPLQNVDPPGPRGDGVSLITAASTYENQILFPKGVNDAAARTRVFYDANGVITEADIVLNPFLQFSVGFNFGPFDLQATLTHEIGHLLGLDHSSILGSTMSENNGKNGLFGLVGFSPRTLSLSDIAAVRSLYGAPPSDIDCCARIEGKLISINGKGSAGWFIWTEDVDSGRVTASASTRSDGSFTIGGVEAGKVRVFAEPINSKGKYGVQSLGEYLLKRGISQSISIQIKNQGSGLPVSFIGFGDQLAKTAVIVNAGSSYRVLVAGQGLDPKNLTVSSSSPWVKVRQVLSDPVDFGDAVEALAFDVDVSKEATDGDYTLFVTAPDGSSHALVGSLTVEKFPNI